jgi:cell division protein FtsB
VIRPEAPVRSDSFRPVLGVTVLLLFALLAMAALKSSRDLETARARERSLQAQIAQTQGESERLRVRIDRLRHDPGMLEKLAREDLGMARPADVIIELPEAAATSPAPAAPLPPAPAPPSVPKPTPAVSSAPPSAPPAAVPVSSSVPVSGPPGRE